MEALGPLLILACLILMIVARHLDRKHPRPFDWEKDSWC